MFAVIVKVDPSHSLVAVVTIPGVPGPAGGGVFMFPPKTTA
jgi:hypothetical protein